MEMNELIALGILVVVALALVIYEAVIQNRLREKLRTEQKNSEFWFHEVRLKNVELETVKNRCESGISHQVFIRDQKIEELEKQMDALIGRYENEIQQRDMKIAMQDELLEKKWQKATKK